MYYFNRPNYGYAYGNPYRMNFSRRYPRVVVYNGQQNFEMPKWLKKLGAVASLGAALNPIGAGIGKTLGHAASESGIVKTKSNGTIIMPNPKFDINNWKLTAPDGTKSIEYVETSADNPDLVDLSPIGKLLSPESVKTLLLGEKSPNTSFRNHSLFIQAPSSEQAVATTISPSQKEKVSEQASRAQKYFNTDKPFRMIPMADSRWYLSPLIPSYYPKAEKTK